MYLYFIERFDDMPFDAAIDTLKVNKVLYDVLKQNKDSGLDSISTHIVDLEQRVFFKTNPRESQEIRHYVSKFLGQDMNDYING